MSPKTDIEQAIEAMRFADQAARDRLPAPPRGMYWHQEVEVATSTDGTLVKLTYSVRPRHAEIRPAERRR